MWCELKGIIHGVERKVVDKILSKADVNSKDLSYPRSKLQRSPACVKGEYFSTSAMVLSSLCKRLGIEFEVKNIAGIFVEQFLSEGWGEYFDLDVADAGQVNFYSKPRLCSLFVDEILSSQCRFFSNSLLSELILSSLVDSKDVEEWQSLMDFSAVPSKVEELFNKSEKDQKVLLLIQAAGMCADPEIHSHAFFQGLYSSENVPWYLGHWSKTSHDFIHQLSVKEPRKKKNSRSYVRKFIEEIYRELLFLREDLHLIQSAKRLDCLLALGFRWSRIWFSFYNRPETRDLSALGEMDREELFRVISLVSRISILINPQERINMGGSKN